MPASTEQIVTVDGRAIKLTNLDKVLYPQTGTTKADVLFYYAQVGPTMLPHLYERPATRKRWPDGVGTPDGKPPTVFFNKDLAKGTPDWVQRRTIAHRDHDNDYPVVNDLATLTWLAQLAALELHVPQWRFGPDGAPQRPDRMVLDLDPGPGVSLAECAEIALRARSLLRDMFDALDLQVPQHDPVPVTSGSKGIHLYAALDGRHDSEEITALALELARTLEAEAPDRVISAMKRSERDGKVFIDWSQNNGAKTTVSPYSLRGRDQPMVAAPRSWAELADPDVRQLRYDEVVERVLADPDPLGALGSRMSHGGPDRLATYRSMRDAGRTPEPVPAEPAPAGAEGQTFVIQEHHARRLHYDFRLERDGGGRDQPTVAAPRSWAELADPDVRQLLYDEVVERVLADPDPLGALGSRMSHGGPDRLATYRSMRDAGRTPEPVPAEPAPAGAEGQTFVIQEHHARRLHYDFRLERDGVLVSWAVPKAPPTDPKVNHLAVQTEDHPLEYAAFEGSIPRGEYGGGEVSIWDAGTYELHKWIEGKEVIVTLHGRADGGLGGGSPTFALIHTGGRGGEREQRNWLMHLMTAAPGSAADARPAGTAAESAPPPASVSTPDALPVVSPMLATPEQPTTFGASTGWAFEMKWDGVRILSYLAGGAGKLMSRRGRDDTIVYADVLPALEARNVADAILDGEMVVADADGRPSFGLLQNRMNLTRPADVERAARVWPAQYMVFDLLRLNGEMLLGRSYDDRRALLEQLFADVPGSRLQVPPMIDGDVHTALKVAEDLRLEGVVAKRRASRYEPGRRSHDWVKLKLQQTQEIVIAGWRPGQGRRDGTIGSLLMGVPDEHGLHYVGRVGSGLDERSLAELARLLTPLARDTPPLYDVPREDARDARWVEPELVGEVSYGELTGPGRLRHPVWRGLRPDKAPDHVVWERSEL